MARRMTRGNKIQTPLLQSTQRAPIQKVARYLRRYGNSGRRFLNMGSQRSPLRANFTQAGVLRVRLIGLCDGACDVIPRDRPRHDKRVENSSGHRARSRCLQEASPIEPQGEITFEQQHAYKGNRGFWEKQKSYRQGDASGEVAEKTRPP